MEQHDAIQHSDTKEGDKSLGCREVEVHSSYPERGNPSNQRERNIRNHQYRLRRSVKGGIRGIAIRFRRFRPYPPVSCDAASPHIYLDSILTLREDQINCAVKSAFSLTGGFSELNT